MAHNNLSISQRSSTTVQYTVTNRVVPRTFAGKAIFLVEHIFRLLAGLWSSVALLLLAQQQWHSWRNPLPPTTSPNGILEVIRQSIDGQFASTPPVPVSQSALKILTDPSSAPAQLPVLLLITVFFLSRFMHTTTESLLVLRSLGMQTSRTTSSFPLFMALSGSLRQRIGFDFGLGTVFGSLTIRFLPADQIQDILIHEGFIGWQIRHYLAIVVLGDTELVVVFERILPRLDVVEDVWRGARNVLWADHTARNGKERVHEGSEDD